MFMVKWGRRRVNERSKGNRKRWMMESKKKARGRTRGHWEWEEDTHSFSPLRILAVGLTFPYINGPASSHFPSLSLTLFSLFIIYLFFLLLWVRVVRLRRLVGKFIFSCVFCFYLNHFLSTTTVFSFPLFGHFIYLNFFFIWVLYGGNRNPWSFAIGFYFIFHNPDIAIFCFFVVKHDELEIFTVTVLSVAKRKAELPCHNHNQNQQAKSD